MYEVLIIGGDDRNIYLANISDRRVFSTSVWGFKDKSDFKDDVVFVDDILKKAAESDIIVFGLPVSKDGILPYCPLGCADTTVANILNEAKKDAIILGGRAEDEFSHRICDYTKRADFAYLNAVPTAEGALYSAMSQSKKTVQGSLCMVTGFGRCAEILAIKLKALDAAVHIFARSAKDIAHASSMGFRVFHISELAANAGNYDLIFNTVPFGIFGDDAINNTEKNVIFIDIASAPGGIAENAHKETINYKFLPGLPGKYSPISAAGIIEKVILEVMRENGKDVYP